MPFRPICDLYSKADYVIDSSGLVSPRTTAQANGHCTYVNGHMYMHEFILKSTLGSKNNLETSSVFLGKMDGFVESDQTQRTIR